MARDFLLPDLGSGLQECEVLSWYVAVGDAVTSDQMLCQVETEKAVIEIPVPYDGVVLDLWAEQGEVIAVGSRLVTIDGSNEATAPTVPSPATVSTVPSAPGGTPDPLVPDDSLSSAPRDASRTQGRPLAMPLIRQLARELSVDLTALSGSGRDGRITRRDVEAAAAGASAAAALSDAVPLADVAIPPTSAAGATTRVRLSRTRRSIAAHMTARWREVPHITGTTQIEVSGLIRARAVLSERLGRKIPIEAFLVAACVPALRDFPEMNASLDGDELVLRADYAIGVAMATTDGLLVPVVRDADRLTLTELADLLLDLGSRAESRSLLATEMGGQSFTISNIGAVAGDVATQILPAGTTAITSFGRAREEAVVKDGSVVPGRVMAVAGTFDHRAVDGAPAMRFLKAITDALHDPTLLLL